MQDCLPDVNYYWLPFLPCLSQEINCKIPAMLHLTGVIALLSIISLTASIKTLFFVFFFCKRADLYTGKAGQKTS